MILLVIKNEGGKILFSPRNSYCNNKGICFLLQVNSIGKVLVLFSLTLKTELPRENFTDLEDARKEIFKYIEWQNKERLHSSLGYLSPLNYDRDNRHVA